MNCSAEASTGRCDSEIHTRNLKGLTEMDLMFQARPEVFFACSYEVS